MGGRWEKKALVDIWLTKWGKKGRFREKVFLGIYSDYFSENGGIEVIYFVHLAVFIDFTILLDKSLSVFQMVGCLRPGTLYRAADLRPLTF